MFDQNPIQSARIRRQEHEAYIEEDALTRSLVTRRSLSMSIVVLFARYLVEVRTRLVHLETQPVAVEASENLAGTDDITFLDQDGGNLSGYACEDRCIRVCFKRTGRAVLCKNDFPNRRRDLYGQRCRRLDDGFVLNERKRRPTLESMEGRLAPSSMSPGGPPQEVRHDRHDNDRHDNHRGRDGR